MASRVSTARRSHSATKRQTETSAGDGLGPIEQSIDQVVKLDQRDRLSMSWSDRLADRITAFSGSMLFFYLNLAWFAVWIPLNLGWFGVEPFDPFPFGLLTMIVSLEAIFLATFVLISQNRQAQLADKRAKVDLQVDMIAEQEITKIMRMLIDIHGHMGLGDAHDPDLKELARKTDVAELLDKMDELERQVDPKGAAGPRSAVDTSV